MISIIVTIIVIAVIAFSLRWNWWRLPKKGIVVLMYHKVGYPPENSQLKELWVSPEVFAKQVDYLTSHGFTPIHFKEFHNYLKTGAALPEKPVLITFDDGYKNNYEYAYKILKEKKVKGNIFIICNTIGKQNIWHEPSTEAWIPMCSWEELEEMENSGVFEIGSHTMDHFSLEKLTPEKVKYQLTESKKFLEEKLKRPVPAFAYPYGSGAYIKAVRDEVFKTGYGFDFSVRQGITPLPWKPEDGAIKRLFIRGDNNMLDFALQVSRGKSKF